MTLQIVAEYPTSLESLTELHTYTHIYTKSRSTVNHFIVKPTKNNIFKSQDLKNSKAVSGTICSCYIDNCIQAYIYKPLII